MLISSDFKIDFNVKVDVDFSVNFSTDLMCFLNRLPWRFVFVGVIIVIRS